VKLKLSVLIAVLLVACNNPATVERIVDLNKTVKVITTFSPTMGASKFLDSVTSRYTQSEHCIDTGDIDRYQLNITVPESTTVIAYYHDTTKTNPHFYIADTLAVRNPTSVFGDSSMIWHLP
jgi:hypothetical protein